MSLLTRMLRRFRIARMRLFFSTFRVSEHTRILDVGGTTLNWMLLSIQPQVTLLNMPRWVEAAPQGFQTIAATGCELPFEDQVFDVVFSNSVIEHIGDPDDRRRFASETRRVGKRYWVETPNRWFPIEQHLCTPFIHYLPHSWQRFIAQHGTLWDYLEHPSPDRRKYYIEHYLRDIRLLVASELARLFPDGHILREKFVGFTKSLIVFR